MLTVRQVLTEILLDVTNEEIRNIAKDTVNKAQYKGSLKAYNLFFTLIFIKV